MHCLTVLEGGSKIQVSAGLVSPEAPLLSLQTATFSLCPHIILTSVLVRLCVQIFSYRDSSHMGLGPIHTTLF